MGEEQMSDSEFEELTQARARYDAWYNAQDEKFHNSHKYIFSIMFKMNRKNSYRDILAFVCRVMVDDRENVKTIQEAFQRVREKGIYNTAKINEAEQLIAQALADFTPSA